MSNLGNLSLVCLCNVQTKLKRGSLKDEARQNKSHIPSKGYQMQALEHLKVLEAAEHPGEKPAPNTVNHYNVLPRPGSMEAKSYEPRENV